MLWREIDTATYEAQQVELYERNLLQARTRHVQGSGSIVPARSSSPTRPRDDMGATSKWTPRDPLVSATPVGEGRFLLTYRDGYTVVVSEPPPSLGPEATVTTG